MPFCVQKSYQSGSQKPYIEDRQTMQWLNGKGQKDKQWSIKHYTENYRLNNSVKLYHATFVWLLLAASYCTMPHFVAVASSVKFYHATF